jgi:predicted ATPase/DNA-binding SARP family transcriptional activator
MQGLRVALLGEPKLSVDGRPLACASKKALALFVYVALHGDRLPRRDLARMLWGPGNEEAARTSLRTALQRLPAELADCLAIEREHIALVGPADLDTRQFTALAASHQLDDLARAATLYGGALLANFDLVDAAPEFDDWLFRERARYLQLAQSVFDRLVAGHRARAHASQAAAEREAAMAAVRRWLALEPASEPAHRWLMQLFVDAGQREAALAQYAVCQRELAVASGRAPGPQTRALAEGLQAAQGPRGTATPAPLDAAVRAPELAGTSFVGRGDELAELSRLLAEPSCRLLTLHGLGGAGKSRLAFALASQLGARHAQGATWIALSGVSEAAQLAPAVARALAIELPAQPDPTTALCNALSRQERLLVLDNFEHLVADPPACELVLSLLRQAPRITLLVTSREVLGLQEEWVYELGGLGCPPADATAEAAADAPAAQLFVQRARQAYLGFSHQAEWPHIVRLCRLTEGLPLALELAAAWVRTVPCADLVQAIDTEMTALSARHRNRPPRQASLDAVVRTSRALLSKEQQQVLAALSVFVDGFTNEAAQAVAQAPLRVLSALGDKALVSRSEAGRLSLHPLVRQFAAAQLARTPSVARLVQRRFAGFYAGLLAQARGRLDGPDEVEATAALNLELRNLLAAQERWIEAGAEPADGIAEAMLRVLLGCGLFREALALASRLLDAWPGAQPATRAMVLAYRARARCLLGDLAEGQRDFDAAIELGRSQGLTFPVAYAMLYAATIPYIEDKLDVALERLDAVEPTLAELGDPVLTMRARFNAAVVSDAMGRTTAAERKLREALALAEQAGSPSFVATVRSNLANSFLKQGRLAEAETLLREALALYERIDRPQDVARVLNSLALSLLWRSQPALTAEAAAMTRRALKLFEHVGYTPGQSYALDTLGQAMWAMGRVDEAREHLARADSLGGPVIGCEAKFHLALLEAEQGEPARARQLALEHLHIAQRQGLDVLTRATVLLAAALAAAMPTPAAGLPRWLQTIEAQGDLSFEEKRLLAKLQRDRAAPASENPGCASVSVAILLPEVRAFLETPLDLGTRP